jgi:hypothetical protein
MKSTDAVWTEYERLLAQDRFDEADALLAQIEPISDEEWLKRLHNAPYDDEPISESLRIRLDTIRSALAANGQRIAG